MGLVQQSLWRRSSHVWCWSSFIPLDLPHLTIKFRAGWGTNNQAEYIALWILLNFGLKTLQLFGDYKLLVDWLNSISQITNIVLGKLIRCILDATTGFEALTVYRELNQRFRMQTLSKEAVSPQEGILISQESRDGLPLPAVTLSLSWALSKKHIFCSVVVWRTKIFGFFFLLGVYIIRIDLF